MQQRIIYCTNRPPNPFILVIVALLTVAAFFIALPIFLAALAVFTGTALYMGWKFKKALKDAQRQMEKMHEYNHVPKASGMIIDITNEE